MNILQKLLNFRWLINLIGLKALYQITYIVFNLIIVKKLSVAEYGVYSYIVALIVYFSSIPLLGFPLYLQKNVSRSHTLEAKYLLLAMTLCLIAFCTVFFFMPAITPLQKFFIATIILVNCAITIPVSVNDGMGRYSFQYKLLLFNSVWMIVCIAQAFIFHGEITLNNILNYWWVNAVAAFLVISVLAYLLLKTRVSFTAETKRPYYLILMDLLFLYSISIPDGFARFYDRFLAHHYLGDQFLGSYSFNLMVITTIYALFIRPINSVLFTELSKAQGDTQQYLKVIKRYYLFGLMIYGACFLFYAPFSKWWLIGMGLEKYIGTLNIFYVCFLNAVFYFLSLPFVSLIALSESNRNKLFYCCLSVLIFNIPLVLLLIAKTQEAFLGGFLVAYFVNLVLCLGMEWRVVRLGLLNLSFLRALSSGKAV